MTTVYTVKPKADLDLDVHADYLTRKASPEIAMRFLDAAHDTFGLLAKRPNIGWLVARLTNPQLTTLRVFRPVGLTFFVWSTARETCAPSFAGARN